MGVKITDRIENWNIVLEKAIAEESNRPFIWGKNDCILTSLRIAGKLIKQDIIEEYQLLNQYNSPSGSYKYLKTRFGSFEEALNLKFPRKEKHLAIAGDLATINTEFGTVVGIIINGGLFVACKSEEKMIHYKMDKVINVWGV